MFRHKKTVHRRRKHKNSKIGCNVCKRRHVKCQENLPACTNCVMVKLHCEYLDYSDKEIEEFLNQKNLQATLHELSAYHNEGESIPENIALPSPNRMSGGNNGACNTTTTINGPQATGGSQIRNQIYLAQGKSGREYIESQPPWGPIEVSPSPVLFNLLPLSQSVYSLMDSRSSAIVHRSVLPRVKLVRRRFIVAHRTTLELRLLLLLKTMVHGPNLEWNETPLAYVGRLYHLWIEYFIVKAHNLDALFSSLIAFTANYLISGLLFTDAEPLCSLSMLTNSRKTLTTLLLQHYSAAIKGLVLLLDHNSHPEIANVVLYILLLTSIYDRGGTLESTKRFRDGIFTVLNYTWRSANNKGVLAPCLIPTQLHLAKHVSRAVYLPAYHPEFLIECEMMLSRLGSVLDLTHNQSKSMQLRRKFNELRLFVQDAIRIYVPVINENLDDVNCQEEVLYIMFKRWALLQSTKCVVLWAPVDPLERVVHLFNRLFRIAVIAVVPQAHFFLLHDFESPLMFDLLTSYNDVDVFYELHITLQCMPPEVYSILLPKIQALAAYAIRLITFFQTRINILYEKLVYDERVDCVFPFENVLDWHDSMLDMKSKRAEICEKMGLSESPITSFMLTYITPLNFPHIVGSGVCRTCWDIPQIPDGIHEVNLLSLQPNGFLLKDWSPST